MFIQFPHLILKTITFCHLGSMGAAKSCPAYCQRLDFQVDQAAHFSDQIRKSVRLGFQLQFSSTCPTTTTPYKSIKQTFSAKRW